MQFYSFFGNTKFRHITCLIASTQPVLTFLSEVIGNIFLDLNKIIKFNIVGIWALLRTLLRYFYSFGIKKHIWFPIWCSKRAFSSSSLEAIMSINGRWNYLVFSVKFHDVMRTWFNMTRNVLASSKFLSA